MKPTTPTTHFNREHYARVLEARQSYFARHGVTEILKKINHQLITRFKEQLHV